MPKNKPNKGLLKRIRFTKSGKVKFRRAFGRHLRSHKSGKLMRSYRRPAYAKAGDVRRVRAMLFTSVRSGVSRPRTESNESKD
ncbi:MAG: 50S ribosomal protein L35 [Phycisphaerales bacterium]